MMSGGRREKEGIKDGEKKWDIRYEERPWGGFVRT
jgi:hypothetical protein